MEIGEEERKVTQLTGFIGCSQVPKYKPYAAMLGDELTMLHGLEARKIEWYYSKAVARWAEKRQW